MHRSDLAPLYAANRKDDMPNKTLSLSGCGVNGKPGFPLPRAGLPRVLLFDIETAPHTVYTFQCIKAWINPNQIIKASEIMCFAAKWLGAPLVMFDSYQRDKNDKRVVRQIRSLLCAADVVVAHNGRAFDHKHVNTRMLFHGMKPPTPYKTVDTYRMSQSLFVFPRHKLDGIARYLASKGKVEHEGFALWEKCMRREHAAWKRMEKYNIQDVLLLEEIYLRFRPWDKKHPNIGLMHEDGIARCVACGSSALRETGTTSYTAARTFPVFECRTCGKMMRGRSAHKRDNRPVGLANVV